MSAKRVTITLPDDLADRLEPFRDRVNVSLVASQALEGVVRDLEGVRTSDKPLVARLRSAIPTVEDRDRLAGYKSGVEWANSFEDGEAALVAHRIISGLDLPFSARQFEAGSVQLAELWWDGVMEELQDALNDGRITNGDAYIFGLLQGMGDTLEAAVNEAWRTLDLG